MKILRKRMKELRLLVALIRRKLGRYLNQQLLLRLKQLIIATRKLQLSRQLSRVRPSSITKIDHKAENSYSERSIAKAYLSEGKDRQLNAKFNMQDALYRQYVASSVVAHHLYISKVNYFVSTFTIDINLV